MAYAKAEICGDCDVAIQKEAGLCSLRPNAEQGWSAKHHAHTLDA